GSEMLPAPTGVPAEVSAIVLAGTQGLDATDLSQLADVSGSFAASYARTSFDDRTGILYADVAIENHGQYSANVPLYVGVTNISDPSVRVLGAAGVSQDGVPFYDFTQLVDNEGLAPGTSTRELSLAFANPNRGQFTYDLVFLGMLNR